MCEWFSVCSFKTKATAIYFNTACIYSYNQLFRLQHTLRPFETFRCELVALTLVTSDTQWLEGKSVWCRSVLGDLWQVFCALSPSALILLRSELRYLCGFNLNGSLLIVQIEPPPPPSLTNNINNCIPCKMKQDTRKKLWNHLFPAHVVVYISSIRYCAHEKHHHWH